MDRSDRLSVMRARVGALNDDVNWLVLESEQWQDRIDVQANYIGELLTAQAVLEKKLKDTRLCIYVAMGLAMLTYAAYLLAPMICDL